MGAPLLTGTVNATRSAPAATDATRSTVVAAGAPTVTGADNAEAGPSTTPFSAATVKR